jgi:hypothetical protein
LPTFPVFNASPAGRAAPQKLAYHEIARSAVDTAGDKESPRNRSRRGTRPHPPSRASFISSHPGHGPGGFVQRSSYRILCTMVHKRKTSASERDPHNHNKSLLLRRSWLRSAKPRETRPPTPPCVHPRRFITRNQTAPPEISHPQTKQGVRFFVAPQGRSSAPPHAQRCTNPKPLHLPLSG